MRHHHRPIAATAILGLLLVGVAAPATAATNGRIGLVQGVPGMRVDICIDGREVKSGLRYGRTVKRSVAAGSHNIKFFKRDPRRCRGVKLGQRKVTVEAGQQLTIVVSRGSPKVIEWDSAPFASAGINDSIFIWGHAAKVGPVYIHREISTPVQPGAFATFSKGQRLVTFPAPGPERRIVSWVVRVSDGKTLAGPRERLIPTSRMIEMILVGTKLKNYRYATIDSPVPD